MGLEHSLPPITRDSQHNIISVMDQNDVLQNRKGDQSSYKLGLESGSVCEQDREGKVLPFLAESKLLLMVFTNR